MLDLQVSDCEILGMLPNLCEPQEERGSEIASTSLPFLTLGT